MKTIIQTIIEVLKVASFYPLIILISLAVLFLAIVLPVIVGIRFIEFIIK